MQFCGVMRSVTFLIAVLAATPLASAGAQEPFPIKVGDTVRVSHDCVSRCREDKGTVGAVEADSIVLSAEQGQLRVVILLTSVSRLSVVRGQKSHWVTGAIVGGVALGTATAIAVISVCDPWGTSEPVCSVTTGGIVALTAAGAAVGAAIGAGIGSLVKSDRWEDVPLDQLRVSLVPHGRGLLVGISAAF